MKPKFKVWDGKNNVMWDNLTDIRFDSKGEIYYLRGICHGESIGAHRKFVDLTQFKLRHYTSFKLKNDKEVFQDDIVEVRRGDKIKIGFVRWNPNIFGWCIDCNEENTVESLYMAEKVIGNIHQNPELLEGSK